MNNFPAMTEEQRQLAALCKIEIKRWQAASESNPNMRYMVELMEIALAALTAEPVGWMVKYGGIDKEMFVDKQAAARLYHDVTENGFLDVDMLQLYTAPPAPVLRVPEWTNEQCLEFLSIAFRHAEISGDIEMDDIRLGIKMVNAAAPEVE